MNTESSKIVTSYFLKIASPESVYDWLKERAFDLSKHNCLPREYNDNGRADYKALLERNDELITLGLAQYARDSDVLERILDKACANAEMELACACLSNPHIKDALGFIPSHFYRTECAAYIVKNRELLLALLSNPWIAGEWVCDLLQRNEAFEDLDDETWITCVNELANNKTLTGQYSYLYGMKPGVDYWYNARNAVWDLLRDGPTTSELAWALNPLLFGMWERNETPQYHWEHDKVDKSKLIKKWAAKGDDDNDDDYVFSEMRMLITLGLGQLGQSELRSNDPAIRKAFYLGFSPDELGNDWRDYLDPKDESARCITSPEIALRNGFFDCSHFGKQFHAMMGVSPGTHRKKWKQ